MSLLTLGEINLLHSVHGHVGTYPQGDIAIIWGPPQQLM